MFPIVFSGGSEKTLTQEEKAVNILYKLSIFPEKILHSYKYFNYSN